MLQVTSWNLQRTSVKTRMRYGAWKYLMLCAIDFSSEEIEKGVAVRALTAMDLFC